VQKDKKQTLGEKMYYVFSVLILWTADMLAFSGIANLTFDEIDHYISNQFASAIVETDPYPHLVIQNILPDPVYQELAKNWPDEKIFDSRGNLSRMRLPVTGGSAEVRNLTDRECELWTGLGRIVNCSIKPRLIQKLIPYFHVKFTFLSKDRLNWLIDHLEFMNSRMDGLNWDRNNFQPGPHIDQAYMLGALILFFADDRDHQEYGTALFTSVNGVESYDVKYGENEPFYVNKILPYLPNTLVCFMQNPKGWHGPYTVYHDYDRKSYFAELLLKPELFKEIYGNLSQWSSKDLYDREFTYLYPEYHKGSAKQSTQNK
jgi:hypothetical protein